MPRRCQRTATRICVYPQTRSCWCHLRRNVTICVCDEYVFRIYSEGNARYPADVTMPLLPLPPHVRSFVSAAGRREMQGTCCRAGGCGCGDENRAGFSLAKQHHPCRGQMTEPDSGTFPWSLCCRCIMVHTGTGRPAEGRYPGAEGMDRCLLTGIRQKAFPDGCWQFTHGEHHPSVRCRFPMAD